MVSRVDVHIYSMASAIKDLSTTSMSQKYLLRLKTEAPIPKNCCIHKPLQPVVSQWTPLATIPKYTQIAILPGLNCTKFTTRQSYSCKQLYMCTVEAQGHKLSSFIVLIAYTVRTCTQDLLQYIKSGSDNVPQNLVTYRESVLRSERLALPAGKRMPTIQGSGSVAQNLATYRVSVLYSLPAG